jgi:hypothetical protein
MNSKTFFGMLAVGLVHRECRYRSKMATQVEKAKCVIWFIETHFATTVKLFIGIRTGKFRQKGKAFMHGASNSKKLVVCVKGRFLFCCIINI